MKPKEKKRPGRTLSLAALLALWMAGAAGTGGAGETSSTAPGVNDPEARFRGPLAYDFGVTNVKWEAATPEYSYVTFDLHWSYSWRVKWTEPAATSATGKDMEVENWDAAWVFVKFLPDKDSKEARERNHWLHATLDENPASHVMPAGAINSVKLSDGPASSGAGGSRGMGVFIYRDAVGHGVNDWKGIKLRWLHPPASRPQESRDSGAASPPADSAKFDPARAAVRVYAIPMVYVPEGAFKIGSPKETGFTPFADGPDIPKTRFDHEQDFNAIPEGLRKIIETTTSKDGGPYLRWTTSNHPFQYTDGGWRGGKAIPFLLDKEWNAPDTASSRSRRIGPVAGWFWSTHGFSERAGGATFGGPLGGATTLNNDYPTGYDAFYCMKYDVTQGQYCDYLNSLPPDVAAGRAFVSSEEWAMYGQRSTKVKDKLPSGAEHEVTETAGNTIRSSADVPAGAQASGAGSEMGEETKKNDNMDLLLDDAMAERKADGTKIEKVKSIPVYWARLPFRRLPGFCWDDIRAFAVWAGLRPMTGLEADKARQGLKDPAAPPGPASSYDDAGELTMADDGQPTERPLKGLSRYGADYGVRVGCFATPTSDQATARATYWGVTELGGMTVPLLDKTFRGSHGDGTMPAGSPGAPWKRGFVAFSNAPPDWGRWDEYSGRRHAVKICRLAVSAGNRVLKPAGEAVAPAFKRKLAAQFPPADARRDDVPRVANVKVEPGKEYSTVSFDLSWKNSWRARWTEPAEKNVTGKPLTIESWDAAWVFVKFRPSAGGDDVPAMLSADPKDHQVPVGAVLDVGATDDGTKGVGVFVYRQAIGLGPNAFNKVALRWAHGSAVDPTKGEVKVHAIAMVYVPEGPFASRSPWGHALKTITDPDATKTGGHLESGPETVPQSPEWPNGFSSFYCMKYSIAQGQYADFLNSIPSRNYNGGRYGVLAHNNARFHSARFYNFNGYTITTNAEGVFMADVPDRACNLLSLPDIQGFAAWAGLRPPTNLEYEKACRGPRAVARAADAWTPATCAPAAGLGAPALEAPSAVGPGPSYWGIRELSLSGCVQEWPAVFQNEPANPGAKQKGACSGYGGTHGSGSPSIPDDWPYTFFGDWYYGGIWRLWGYGTVGHWINADEYDDMPWETMDGERCGRYGARAVRTASAAESKDGPLALDDVPNLAGADVAMFSIRGSFRNDGDSPLKVELSTSLPAVCFPQGVASRAFTAAPKAATPFKIPVAATHLALREALGGRRSMAVQVQGPGGKVLAERKLPMRMGGRNRQQPVILSIDGAKIALNVLNASESPVTLAFEMPSLPAVKIGESGRSLTVAAGTNGVVAFSVPRQWFPEEGVCLVPYRVTLGSGTALAGEAPVELRVSSRWWVSRKAKSAPKLAAGGDDLGGGDLGGDMGLTGIANYDASVFKANVPPQGWQRITCAAGLDFGQQMELPTPGSSVLAATRVEMPTDREVMVSVTARTTGRFILRVWGNGVLVYEQHPPKARVEGAKPVIEAKRFRVRAGGNPLLLECESEEDKAATIPPFMVEILDAKDGKPVDGVMFDMERKDAR